jgi:hypothetical protein
MDYNEQEFGSARPRLRHGAEDVIAECIKSRCEFGAWLVVNSRVVQFGSNARFTRHKGNVIVILRSNDVLATRRKRHGVYAGVTNAFMPQSFVS